MIKRLQRMITKLTSDVESLREQVANRPREEKQKLGQFLTPASVAAQVASLFRPLTPECRHVRLLDPGAGVGSLCVAFVNWLLKQEHRPESVEIVAVELDDNVIPALRQTLRSCEALGTEAGLVLKASIYQGDFLRLCATQAELFVMKGILKEFTHIIMNPPYRKISAESGERQLLKQCGIEVSNIYPGFVALATTYLAPGGELAAITPRSFCNGTYFKDFRQRFFSSMVIQSAHVFVSRQKAFAQDSVLQETILFSARKTKEQPGAVSIQTSEGPNATPREHFVPYSAVLSPKDEDKVIHLPADGVGLQAMEFVTALPATLNDLGISVSTGPVVDFRIKSHLRPEHSPGLVPLLYPLHFSPGGIDWPKQKGRKPNAIVDDLISTPVLVNVGNYVLVKRFSSKEERKRITARVFEEHQFSDYLRVGLENHLNFFHRQGKGLDTAFSFGLATYLNSTVVDTYFRQFNGHTQVNASDLRMMRYPDFKALRKLGIAAQASREYTYDQGQVDKLVQIVLGVQNKESLEGLH